MHIYIIPICWLTPSFASIVAFRFCKDVITGFERVHVSNCSATDKLLILRDVRRVFVHTH